MASFSFIVVVVDIEIVDDGETFIRPVVVVDVNVQLVAVDEEFVVVVVVVDVANFADETNLLINGN